MALTELEIRHAKPRGKPYRLTDGHGLYLDVRPGGRRYWRVRYKLNGKENTLTLGEYPPVSLKEARLKHGEAQRLILSGQRPAAKSASAPLSAELALEYMEKKQRESASEKSRRVLETRITKYIIPFIGGFPPDAVTAPMMLDALRGLEARGAVNTAHRVQRIISQIFRYGIAAGRGARGPAADLGGALTAIPARHFASITDPARRSDTRSNCRRMSLSGPANCAMPSGRKWSIQSGKYPPEK